MSPDPERYFRALHVRRHPAMPMKHLAVSFDDWRPEPARCHDNCDYLVSRCPELNLKVIRGWMFVSEDAVGKSWFEAHSMIEHRGELFDITIDQAKCDSLVGFLRHEGAEEEFLELVRIQSQWSYPFDRFEDIAGVGADENLFAE